MQRRHARGQPARPTPVGRTARAGSRAPTLSTPLNRPRHSATCGGLLPMPPAPASRRQEPVTSKTAGPARSRPTRQAHWALSKAVESPKMPVLSLRIIAMSGEMAATIIATAVGPNLAPVWLGHRLSSCGHSFSVAGPDLIGDLGSEAFRLDSRVQTGNACDPLRAGEAPKRVIITGMTVKTGRLTD